MERQKIRTFKDLDAWKEAHALVLFTYTITKKFPKDELFGIINQMRRCAVSITSNIAEGFSRLSFKEKIQFYSISLGSTTELQNQLLISRDVGYLSDSEYVRGEQQATKVHKILNGLIKGSKKFIVLALYLIPYSLFFTPLPAEAAWYNSNYEYCRELTMTAGGNSGGVATTTTAGFALVATSTLSTLRTTGNGGNITQTSTASGTTTPVDVIITNGTECNDDGGSALLDFYFEKYVSTTGEFVLWVEPADISSTSAKTVLMYYGNGSATDQSDEAGTFGALGEAGVWNLHEDPGTAGAGGILDSTSNNYDGTDTNGDTADLINGMVDGAIGFDGSAEYITLPISTTLASLTGNSTILLWANQQEANGINERVIGHRYTSDQGWEIQSDNTGNETYFAYGNTGDGNEFCLLGTGLSQGVWQMLTVSVNRTADFYYCYKNAVLGDAASIGVAELSSTGNIDLASRAGVPDKYWNGYIDDVRLYSRALHSMDILTIYNNTRSSTLFWTFGSEETEVAPTDWYDPDYGYCRELTMTAGGNSGGVATTTTDGFALVATSTISSLATTLAGGRITNTVTTSGTTTPKDVVVTDGTDCADDGGTAVLDFYFEKYASTTGEFVLWVEPTDISSTTQKSILMYYGNSSASDLSDEAGTFGALGEVAVWNLQEDPGSAGANGILDSTSNNNDATDNGSMTSADQVKGYLGGAFDFDNTDDYVAAPSSASLGVADVFTVMLWLKRATGSGHDTIWWFINLKPYGGINGFDSQKVTFGQFDGTDFGQTTSSRNLDDTLWHHVVWTKTGSAQDVYVDSVEDFVSSDDATIASGNSPFQFGGGDVFPFEGIQDDVRVYSRAIHAMDVLTIFNNTRSSSIFWGFGGEQLYGGGDGTPSRTLRLIGKVRVMGVQLMGL